MKFNLRKIISLTVFSVAIAFTCFSAKAETIACKDASSPELLSYDVSKEGKRTILRFGQITPYIQKLCKSNKGLIPEISSQVEELGKQYNPTTIIFDDVEYTYDINMETLTVIGHEGSVYATAYNFVLNAFNLADESCLVDCNGDIREKATVIANKSGKDYHSEEWYKVYNQASSQLSVDADWGKLSILPLSKIIIKGYVRKIGEEFTIIKSEACPESYSVRVIDMHDSKVNTLCTQAFWRLKSLEKVMFPTDGQPVRISRSCFRCTPIDESIARSSKEFKDICVSVNKTSFMEPCCVVM